MCRELVDAFDQSDASDDVRAVIVTGNGKAFCAGADLNAGFVGSNTVMTPELKEYYDKVGYVDAIRRDGGGVVSLRVARSLKPVIAAFTVRRSGWASR